MLFKKSAKIAIAILICWPIINSCSSVQKRIKKEYIKSRYPEHYKLKYETDYKNVNLLYTSTNRGDIKEVKRLLELGTNPNIAPKSKGIESPFILSCIIGLPEITEIMIEYGAIINPPFRQFELNQPLGWAASKGKINVVKLLISKGANIDGKNAYGQTNLALAIDSNQTKAAILLLESGANPLIENQHGVTPFDIACFKSNKELVKYIINKTSVNFERKVYNGKTTILLLLIEHGKLEMVKYLIEKGADLQVKDSEGNGVLHYAKRSKNEEMIIFINLLKN